jgi:hypothetical protein
MTWHARDEWPTRLGHRWYGLDAKGAMIELPKSGRQRTELPRDVAPGETVEVTAMPQAPTTNGVYGLALDLVQEDVTWFSEQGAKAPVLRIDVGRAVEPIGDRRAPATTVLADGDAPAPRRVALWRAAVTLWRGHPLLGVGPDNFRRLYEAVLSPAPNGQPYTDTRIHANSLYFETLADLGLAGVIALALLMLALVRALRDLWAAKDALGLGLSVSAATFFVHGVADYFLEFTPTFGLFWMLLGLTAARDRAEYRAPGGIRR